MDVNTVTMEPEAAAKAFQVYRDAFREQHDRIDGELMRTYKALSEGKTLISLADAIKTGGLDDVGRPRLAIARADERQIGMSIGSRGEIEYTPGWSIYAADRRFELPPGTLVPPQAYPLQRSPWAGQWVASTPFIPPQYRPPHALVNYHLLWEAQWRRARGQQLGDPMLLRRLSADVFAVVAAWDLTDVEKLVLASHE